MLAKVIRIIDYVERQHVTLEGSEGRRYHVTVQAIKDHNNNIVGHKSWLRRESLLYRSQDTAIDAALEDIERLEGRQLPAASAPAQRLSAPPQGHVATAQPQPASKSPHATP